MRVANCLAHIEALAPLPGQCDWDVSGVQVASRKEDVSRMAVMLDATPERVAETLAWGADFLLAHHPLGMKPKALNKVDGHFEIIRQLLVAEAWCYAAHTSLDAQVTQPHGPAGWLAQELALQDLRVIEPTLPEDPAVGIGAVGRLPAPLDWPAMCEAISTLFPGVLMRQCGPIPETIATVGFCGGSGESLAAKAVAMGADLYITGDLKYHAALDTTTCLLDVGHFSIEEEMMRRTAQLLSDRFAKEDAAMAVQFFPGKDPFQSMSTVCNA